MNPLDLAVFAAAFAGACGGFLWFNAAPARIIMGDVGALAIGTAMALLALTANTQLLLILICGINVMEAGSVAVQMGCSRRPAARSACSACRRSTTTSSSSAGRRPRSSSVSGSSAGIFVATALAHLHRRLHQDHGQPVRQLMTGTALVYGIALAGDALRRSSSDVVGECLVADDEPTDDKRAMAAGSAPPSSSCPTTSAIDRSSRASTSCARRRAFPRPTPSCARRIAAGRPLRTEIDLAYEWEQERPGGPRPMLAVTGTDGKTTTTLLAADILRAPGLAAPPSATPRCRSWRRSTTTVSTCSSSSAAASACNWIDSFRAGGVRVAEPGARSSELAHRRWRRTRRPRPVCGRTDDAATSPSASPTTLS